MSSYDTRQQPTAGQYGPRDFKPIHRAIICSSRTSEGDGTTIYHPHYLQDKSDEWIAAEPGVAVSREDIA